VGGGFSETKTCSIFGKNQASESNFLRKVRLMGGKKEKHGVKSCGLYKEKEEKREPNGFKGVTEVPLLKISGKGPSVKQGGGKTWSCCKWFVEIKALKHNREVWAEIGETFGSIYTEALKRLRE